MALTKVKLIADGTIVQSNLHASHGITTADIGEGSNLYYTDARARAAVSVSGNALSYNSSTGVITSNFEESPVFTGTVTINNNAPLVLNGTDPLISFQNGGSNHWQVGFENTQSDRFIFYDNNAASYRMVIDSSGRVGISTTSPAQKLHIVDSSTSYALAETTGTGTSAGFRMKGDASADYTLFTTQGTNQFAIYDNAANAERIRITSGGNIGIGTTSPDSITSGGSVLTLGRSGSLGTDDVVGALSFYTNDASFTAYHSDGISAQISAHSDNPNGASGRLSFYTAYGSDRGERMRIDSSGNIGIGTTDPTSALTINKTSGAVGILLEGNGTDVGKFQVASAGVNHAIQFGTISNNEIQFHTANTEKMRITNSGYVGIGLTNPAVKLEIQDSTHTTMKIRSGNNDNILFAQAIQSNDARIGTETNTDLSLYTNGSERMRIDNEGLVVLKSMGVNTTRNLVFEGDSNSTSGNAGAIGMFADGARLTSNYYYSGGQAKYVSGNGQAAINLQTGTTAAGTFMSFGVNPPADAAGVTERMRIDSSGIIQIDGYGNGAYLRSIGSVRIDIDSDNNQTDRSFIVSKHSAGDELFRVQENGSVGIGTSSPSQKLHVSGGNILVNNGNSAEIHLNSSSNYVYGDINGVAILNGGNNLRLRTNGSERIRIDSSGNVGIGTTSPGTKLSIVGSSSSTVTDLLRIQNPVNTAGTGHGAAIILHSTPDVNRGVQIESSSVSNYAVDNDMVFRTSTSSTLYEKMRLTSGGNLGIGTTSPQSKLHVNGGGINLEQGGQLTERTTGIESSAAQNTWYTVHTFNQYELALFFLLAGFEDDLGDSNNRTAIFVDSGSSSYGSGFAPTRLTGSTSIEARRSGQALQIRFTHTAGGSNRQLRWSLITVTGN